MKYDDFSQLIRLKLLQREMKQKELALLLNRKESSLSRAIDSGSSILLKQLVAVGFLSESEAYKLSK